MPVAVNISFGNTYGARDGTSLLERFIDDISNIWKSCICIGTGNEGATAGHTSGRLREKTVEEQNIGNRNLLENVRANTEQEIELAVQEKQPSLNAQIWKRYVDQIDISMYRLQVHVSDQSRSSLEHSDLLSMQQKYFYITGSQVHLAQTRRSIWISSHAGAI